MRHLLSRLVRTRSGLFEAARLREGQTTLAAELGLERVTGSVETRALLWLLLALILQPRKVASRPSSKLLARSRNRSGLLLATRLSEVAPRAKEAPLVGVHKACTSCLKG